MKENSQISSEYIQKKNQAEEVAREAMMLEDQQRKLLEELNQVR
jgi:hypothetical protein